jgi:hypothetical protein
MNQFRFDNLDAAENAFFERQLEFVKTQTYDVKYPNLIARTLVPVDGSVPPGAETVKYSQYDQVGLAKIISTYGKDLPRADVKAKEFRSVIKSLGTAYGYTTQEVRSANFGGVPLDARKAGAARRAMEEKIDALAFSGDASNGLQGFNAITNAGVYTVPNDGTGTTKTWSTKTPDQILRDLNMMVQQVIDNTYGIEVPDTILMPLNHYGRLTTTARSATSDTTILAFFLANSPYIKNVQPWYRLTGAGSGATDRMIAYRRSPDALSLVIPMEFTQYAPQQDGLEFEIPCEARYGGVICYYPLSIVYGDGI